MSTLTYFDSWYWSTNATRLTCPGIGGFRCDAPGACARDPNINKWYCCNANTDPYSVCWTGATTCSTDGSTFQCGSGQNKWCCISKREVCTPASDQINICWSTGYDTLRNISVPALQSAHSSLSAAAPTASSITFDPLSLIAQTAPPSTSTSTSTTETSTTSKTSTTGPAAAQTDPAGAGSPAGSVSSSASPGLSGGAIAGIAVGVAAGLALVALGIFFLWRRNKTKKDAASSNDQYQYQQQQAYHPDGTPLGSPLSSEMPGSAIQPYYHEAYAKAGGGYPGRPELLGTTPGIELPPSHTPSELDGDHVQQPR